MLAIVRDGHGAMEGLKRCTRVCHAEEVENQVAKTHELLKNRSIEVGEGGSGRPRCDSTAALSHAERVTPATPTAASKARISVGVSRVATISGRSRFDVGGVTDPGFILAFRRLGKRAEIVALHTDAGPRMLLCRVPIHKRRTLFPGLTPVNVADVSESLPR
jgi:hypothetical protein